MIRPVVQLPPVGFKVPETHSVGIKRPGIQRKGRTVRDQCRISGVLSKSFGLGIGPHTRVYVIASHVALPSIGNGLRALQLRRVGEASAWDSEGVTRSPQVFSKPFSLPAPPSPFKDKLGK